ncbi:synaptotagmin-like protein 3 isoform X2 [Mus musculus]|uniref:synaptotagmin-like protein 3 isoform X2 n=1 Tax=Mus musculus TaxID=10090 RepID=UPI0003D72E7E|nr:synaptotagmin-like protein 3 isoform X2 [Mus musculus]|eukprot:XP_006523332.1 PREDICTED: synaptotagmin-like protein 3 isoform X1 [Mus musculus]
MAHEVDLESLKELERDIILRVLYRDQTVQSTEEERVRKLKSHLQHLRWKGAKSSSQEYKEKCCARCQRALGLLLNRGAVCQGCSHRVCSECRVFLRRTRAWKCTVCFEDRNVKIKTGEWFFEERARKFPTAAKSLWSLRHHHLSVRASAAAPAGYRNLATSEDLISLWKTCFCLSPPR